MEICKPFVLAFQSNNGSITRIDRAVCMAIDKASAADLVKREIERGGGKVTILSVRDVTLGEVIIY